MAENERYLLSIGLCQKTIWLYVSIHFVICLSNPTTFVAAGYVDPKKTFFNFEEHEESNDNGPKEDRTELLDSCLLQKETLCSQFKSILRFIRDSANQNEGDQTITFDLTLTRSQLIQIDSWLHSSKCIDGIPPVFSGLHARPLWKLIFFDKFLRTVEGNKLIISAIATSLCVFLLLIYWVSLSKSWTSSCLKLFALGFILSTVLTFIKKYQEAIVRNYVKMKMGIPAECRPQELNWYEHVWYFFKGLNSIKGDECEEYYKAELMDPIFQTTITEAFSETLSRMVMTPFPIIFDYVGQSFVKLFQVLPWWLWIPIGIGLPIYLFCVLLVQNKYRFRSFIAVIEPAGVAIAQPTNNALHETRETELGRISGSATGSNINITTSELSLAMTPGNLTIKFGDQSSTRNYIDNLQQDVLPPVSKEPESVCYLQDDVNAITRCAQNSEQPFSELENASKPSDQIDDILKFGDQSLTRNCIDDLEHNALPPVSDSTEPQDGVIVITRYGVDSEEIMPEREITLKPIHQSHDNVKLLTYSLKSPEGDGVRNRFVSASDDEQ